MTSGSREHEAELSTPTGTLGASDSGIVLDRDGTPNKIGRFLVLQRLGSGGMGLVYSAFDEQLDRKVAIKLLRPHVAHSGRATLGQARLLREAQAMARLAHPNVVTVHEVGTFGDQVFIAMEFLSGVTLKSWLRRTARRWQEVVDVFVQAGRGLAAAHAAGLIHRDFKPKTRCPSQTAPLPPFGRILARRGDLSREQRRVVPRHAAVLATAWQRAARLCAGMLEHKRKPVWQSRAI